MRYHITEEWSKKFLIDIGLRPGYEESGASFELEDVKAWYMQWQKDRAEKKEPYFAGIIFQTHFVYAMKEDDDIKDIQEPSLRLEGEVTKEYHGAIFEDEEKTMEVIFDLAQVLASKARQERVHVTWNNRFFILENEHNEENG